MKQVLHDELWRGLVYSDLLFLNRLCYLSKQAVWLLNDENINITLITNFP